MTNSTETTELLSSQKSYGTASEVSNSEKTDEREDGRSHTSYPKSDLFDSQEHFTKDEIDRHVGKTKRLSIVTVLVTLVFFILSFVSSEDSDSSAAYGFAFDSLLAGLTSAILLWRFWSVKDLEFRNRKREVIALFIVSVCLLITGILVAYRAIKALVREEKHKKSTMLIILSSVSMVVYMILFALEYRLAKRIRSRALRTDSIDCLCGAILALSILVTTVTREFTNKVWFLDGAIALGVAVFSFAYGAHSFVHFVKLYKEYRVAVKTKEYSLPEVVYDPIT